MRPRMMFEGLGEAPGIARVFIAFFLPVALVDR
jgi:hypothetical protein